MNTKLTEKVSIRKTADSDLPALAEWSASAFNTPESRLRWTKESMLKHMREDFNSEHSFVIYDKNSLVGGILAYPCRYDRGRELFLHTIVINRNEQNKGLGKLFLEWFIAYTKTQKFTGIRLDANIHLPSYNWYKKFGFVKSGWEQQLLELT